jgi:transcriptional regulator with XRE-family HTH domain
MIGDRLRTIRKTKQLTQGDIEERTGLSRAYVSRVEQGDAIPNLDIVEMWARALQVPMHQLFYDKEELAALLHLPNRLTSDDIVLDNSREQAAQPAGKRRADVDPRKPRR